jgi:hypothetical protein
MVVSIRPTIIVLAALTVLWFFTGSLPNVDDGTKALLRPPAPPKSVHLERDEALLLAFFCTFVAPIAGMVLALLSSFAVAVVGGLVRPITRLLQLPDATATVCAVGVWLAAVYAARPWWLPAWSWAFDVLTRAYQITFT